jgi:hypothetical protein
MSGAFGYDSVKHERAWEFLREADPDVALLQEVRPPDWAREHWGPFLIAPIGPGTAWGSAIVSRIPGAGPDHRLGVSISRLCGR